MVFMITPIVLLAGCRFSLCVLWPRADQAAIHSQNVFIFRHKLEASWSFTRNFLLRIVFFLGEPSGRWKNLHFDPDRGALATFTRADDAKLSKHEFSVLHFCFLLISSTSHSGRLDGIVDEITGHSYRFASCVLNSHRANYILSPIVHFS